MIIKTPIFQQITHDNLITMTNNKVKDLRRATKMRAIADFLKKTGSSGKYC